MATMQFVRARGLTAVSSYRSIFTKSLCSNAYSSSNEGFTVKLRQDSASAPHYTSTRFYSRANVELDLGIDEYDSIMNPSIFPSTESMLVVDQHFDDADDGDELVAERGHDIELPELPFMSTRTISTSSASSREAMTTSYEYDYDEHQIHVPQTNKVNHAHLMI